MLEATTNARVKELTQLIAAERDPEKFTDLVSELNQLLDGLQRPAPSENRAGINPPE